MRRKLLYFEAVFIGLGLLAGVVQAVVGVVRG